VVERGIKSSAMAAFVFGPKDQPQMFRLEQTGLFECGAQKDLGYSALKLLWRLVEHAGTAYSNDAIAGFLSPVGNRDQFVRERIEEIRHALGRHGKEAVKNERFTGYWFDWKPKCPGGSRGILRHLHVSPKLLPRSAAVEKLKRVLLREREAGTCTYLTAAAGMGGIGKTVLASLAMNDPDVQARFPDGIVAITIGRQPSDLWLEGEIRGIHEALIRREALVGEKSDWKSDWTPNNAYDKILDLLRSKAVLLVVDDLWNVKDIRWLPRELGNSGILITTRHREIAGVMPTVATVEADFLTPEEARELLAFHAGTTEDALPPEADKILLHCGHRHNDSRVPAFAVCMAGAMVHRVGNWDNVLRLFGKHQIQEIGPETPKDYDDHRTIYDWIHVSVDFLSTEDRKRYLICSGLKDDAEIEDEFFQTLWKDRDGLLYRSWLGTLNDACLLNWNKEEQIVTFHDLHMDYLRYRASPRFRRGIP